MFCKLFQIRQQNKFISCLLSHLNDEITVNLYTCWNLCHFSVVHLLESVEGCDWAARVLLQVVTVLQQYTSFRRGVYDTKSVEKMWVQEHNIFLGWPYRSSALRLTEPLNRRVFVEKEILEGVWSDSVSVLFYAGSEKEIRWLRCDVSAGRSWSTGFDRCSRCWTFPVRILFLPWGPE